MFAETVRLPGQKLMVVEAVPPEVTCNCVLAVGYPPAEAVIVADPALEAVTASAARSAVVPGAIKTVEGETVAIAGLLLASEMYRPPSGAGDPKLRGRVAELPGAIVRFAGKRMPAAWNVHCSCEKSAGRPFGINRVNVLLPVT